MMSKNNNLIQALIKFQKTNKCFKANKDNSYFNSKYIDLGQLIKDTREDLINCELCISQFCKVVDSKNILTTRLMHVSGEYLDSDYLLEPVKVDPQGMGSALTYARRYNYMSILGIASSEDDDDGNSASQPPKTKPKSSTTSKYPVGKELESFIVKKAKELKIEVPAQLKVLKEEVNPGKKLSDYSSEETAKLLEIMKEASNG